MSKILILTNHSYMLYRFRRELIERLSRDHEVVLGMPFVGHEDDFKAMGLRCIEIDLDRRSRNPFRDFSLFTTYCKLLKKERPDLVLTYSIKPNVYAGLACSLLKIPYSANVQGLGTAFQTKGLASFVSILYKIALRKAGTVFFENTQNADEFIKRRIIPQSKVTVLPGAGINTDEYPLSPYPEEGTFRFLYLGRLMKEKGVSELFEAMEKINKKKGSTVTLDIVGFFDDDYKEQVESLSARGICTFHGFKSDPRPYYAAAHCVVMPSYHEGMSNVLLEAASMGRPLVTTDIPGCREAVDNGKTGLLVPPKDPSALAEAMLRITGLPPSARAEMGTLACEKMLSQFGKEKVVELTVDALKNKHKEII